MPRTRMFDHDAAIEDLLCGMTAVEVAKKNKVSKTAIYHLATKRGICLYDLLEKGVDEEKGRKHHLDSSWYEDFCREWTAATGKILGVSA